MSDMLDCRGLACPQPVIKTKAAMAAGADEITSIVDSEISASNVTRMAQKAGWAVRQERQADGAIHVCLTRPGDAPAAAPAPTSAPAGNAGPIVVLVKSQFMGAGDDELGAVLMRGFFHAMLELDAPPTSIIFVNSAVKLTIAGSPVLDDLKELGQRGVEIWSCGTCLNFFKLTGQLAVGGVSNMYTILEMLMSAGRLVAP
jgi:selenium metabolism protein YedF